jgi:hypothetical protein
MNESAELTREGVLDNSLLWGFDPEPEKEFAKSHFDKKIKVILAKTGLFLFLKYCK